MVNNLEQPESNNAFSKLAFPNTVPNSLGLPRLSPEIRNWEELRSWALANPRHVRPSTYEEICALQARYTQERPSEIVNTTTAVSSAPGRAPAAGENSQKTRDGRKAMEKWTKGKATRKRAMKNRVGKTIQGHDQALQPTPNSRNALSGGTGGKPSARETTWGRMNRDGDQPPRSTPQSIETPSEGASSDRLLYTVRRARTSKKRAIPPAKAPMTAAAKPVATALGRELPVPEIVHKRRFVGLDRGEASGNDPSTLAQGGPSAVAQSGQNPTAGSTSPTLKVEAAAPVGVVAQPNAATSEVVAESSKKVILKRTSAMKLEKDTELPLFLEEVEPLIPVDTQITDHTTNTAEFGAASPMSGRGMMDGNIEAETRVALANVPVLYAESPRGHDPIMALIWKNLEEFRLSQKN